MTDTELKHSDMVTYLVKEPKVILGQLTDKDVALMHAIIGISTEAGELLDALKKTIIYRKPIDVLNIKEELGDLEFYMEDLRQRLGITREETLKQNITKLGVRYPAYNYSDSLAHERKDKQ